MKEIHEQKSHFKTQKYLSFKNQIFMETIVKFIKGKTINIDEDTNRAYDADLLRIAGLSNVIDEGFTLYLLLSDDEYTKAIRLAAYHENIPIKKARKRIVTYLLVKLGCHIIWGPGTLEEKMRTIDFCHFSIEGLTNFSFSLEQIIQLVNREGFNIKYVEKTDESLKDKPEFTLKYSSEF